MEIEPKKSYEQQRAAIYEQAIAQWRGFVHLDQATANKILALMEENFFWDINNLPPLMRPRWKSIYRDAIRFALSEYSEQVKQNT